MSAGVARESWRFACPSCRELLYADAARLRCPGCGARFGSDDGIWRFLDTSRLEFYERFLREYRTVREREGWGSNRAEYYRSLPLTPRNDPQRDIWRRRAISLRTVLARVVVPVSRNHGRPLSVLDAGAGNCWLSHQLGRLGHQVLAVDLSADETDGLGARCWYGMVPQWTTLQAEFDRLPLAPEQFDLVVFNASLHYSTSFSVTLQEALRVLRPDGAVVLMDSPLYRDAASGKMMVAEREEAFQRDYGFRSNYLQSEQFLTYDRLQKLGASLELDWRLFATEPALRSSLRRRWLRLRGYREPATMPVMVARRKGSLVA